MVLVLMGVSGSGKSTIGHLLSQQTGWRFEDGDDFHSAANRAKMAGGTPLTDEDRWPWLQAIHTRMAEAASAGRSEIFACSALKSTYRAVLADGFAPREIQFALLNAPADLIAERLAERHHEFMNPHLLGSQLATLEPPGDAWEIEVTGTPEEVVQEVVRRLRTAGALPSGPARAEGSTNA